jgi:hypothetical protein
MTKGMYISIYVINFQRNSNELINYNDDIIIKKVNVWKSKVKKSEWKSKVNVQKVNVICRSP